MSIGISLKTQILFCVVFLTRYIDVVYKFHSVYNTCMKLFFIASSFYVLFLMMKKFKATYDPNLDTFRNEYLLVFAAILSLVLCYEYTPVEVNRHLCSFFFSLIKLSFIRFFGHSLFG